MKFQNLIACSELQHDDPGAQNLRRSQLVRTHGLRFAGTGPSGGAVAAIVIAVLAALGFGGLAVPCAARGLFMTAMCLTR